MLASARVHPHLYPPPPHAPPSLFLFPSSCPSLPLHMVEACRGSYTYTRVHTHTHIYTNTYTHTHTSLFTLSFPSLPVGLDQEGTVHIYTQVPLYPLFPLITCRAGPGGYGAGRHGKPEIRWGATRLRIQHLKNEEGGGRKRKKEGTGRRKEEGTWRRK